MASRYTQSRQSTHFHTRAIFVSPAKRCRCVLRAGHVCTHAFTHTHSHTQRDANKINVRPKYRRKLKQNGSLDLNSLFYFLFLSFWTIFSCPYTQSHSQRPTRVCIQEIRETKSQRESVCAVCETATPSKRGIQFAYGTKTRNGLTGELALWICGRNKFSLPHFWKLSTSQPDARKNTFDLEPSARVRLYYVFHFVYDALQYAQINVCSLAVVGSCSVRGNLCVLHIADAFSQSLEHVMHSNT